MADEAALNEQIAAQGGKVRELKTGGADKDAVTAAVKELLALKAKYKEVTGKDHGPPKSDKKSKKKKKAAEPAPAPAPAPKAAKAAKAADGEKKSKKELAKEARKAKKAAYKDDKKSGGGGTTKAAAPPIPDRAFSTWCKCAHCVSGV